MEDNENKGEEQGTEDTGKGNKPETVEILKQQSERIKELEDAAEARELEDSKKQLAGTAEGGQQAKKEPVKTKEETAKEYIEKNFANLK